MEGDDDHHQSILFYIFKKGQSLFFNYGLVTVKGFFQGPTHVGGAFSLQSIGACSNSSENGYLGESAIAQCHLT